MKKLLLTTLILTLTGFAFAQTESKCFEADPLRGGHTVTFKIEGNEIAGTFTVESNEPEMVKTYEFTGMRAGNVLKVKFAKGERPDLTPSSELKSLNWTLVKTADKETLRIKLYGKNYVTNEYKDYFANFESCEPSYDALLKMAKSVKPRRRHNYGPLVWWDFLSFKDTTERKVFSIGVQQGKSLEIKAAGCKISVYLPDGKLYEFAEWESGGEKTFASSTIDRMTIKPIPQNGKYLIVLRKMAESVPPGTVSFRISN